MACLKAKPESMLVSSNRSFKSELQTTKYLPEVIIPGYVAPLPVVSFRFERGRNLLLQELSALQ